MAYDPDVVRRAAAALRERKEQREQKRRALEFRLYREYPELAQLDAALRGTMAEVTELALSGGADRKRRLEEAKTRNLIFRGRRASVLAQAGCGPDALDETPVCPKCRDTGWVEGKMCTCLQEMCLKEQTKQLSSLLDLEGQTFDRARLDVYGERPWGDKRSPRENMSRIFTVCQGYASRFPDYPLHNLFFSGGTGLGKTFLSSCIAGEVSQRGFSVVYDTAIHVFSCFDARRFARDIDQEREARQAVDRYFKCDLLILDDLGSEMTTALVQSALYELLNSRLDPAYRTIISSNLSIEEIRGRYTPQIASRLEGNFRELTFYGEDIRLKG